MVDLEKWDIFVRRDCGGEKAFETGVCNRQILGYPMMKISFLF
jgi:hypothetical protein